MKFKTIHQAASAQIPYKASDTNFWFSDKISDWMPKFREQREEYRERANARNTTGFRRANNAMLCSEKHLIK